MSMWFELAEKYSVIFEIVGSPVLIPTKIHLMISFFFFNKMNLQSEIQMEVFY